MHFKIVKVLLHSADTSITYFELEPGISSTFHTTYTWYKTEDKAAWKASDVSRAEKVDPTNTALGTPTTDFQEYKKNAKYYWFAVPNP